MRKKLKILLATDYSEAAVNAEHYAIKFALDTNAELRLIHVYQIPLIYTPTKPIEYVKSRDDFKKLELQILQLHLDELFKALNLKKDELICDCTVSEGIAGKVIIEEAKEWIPDFIVLGTHGVSILKKVLLGSHAWNVIKKACAPVLAIPIEGKYTGIKNIVFAIEERKGEIKAINYTVRFAKEFDAKVTILHFTNFAISKKYETEKYKAFKHEIQENISYDKLNIILKYHQNIIDGLNDFCLKSNADLLAVSPAEHTFFEKMIMLDYSFTKNMSFQTKLPILCIPEYQNPKSSKFWELFEVDQSYINEIY